MVSYEANTRKPQGSHMCISQLKKTITPPEMEEKKENMFVLFLHLPSDHLSLTLKIIFRMSGFESIAY